jgi:hypothetical protein
VFCPTVAVVAVVDPVPWHFPILLLLLPLVMVRVATTSFERRVTYRGNFEAIQVGVV